MSVFATEFPVSNKFDRARFSVQVLTWLQGAKDRLIFSESSARELDGAFVDIKSKNGENLVFRELEGHSQFWAIGFRYDHPEGGLLWRTEGILRRDYSEQNMLLRIKAQCIATTPLAQTRMPRKIFLLKSLIDDGYAEYDGFFKVSDKPIWLLDGKEADMELAQSVIEGSATNHLPVVYISAPSSGPILSQDDVTKLAFDLGGVAHVVVEPSRNFSFALRDKSEGRNVYGGHVGIFIPKQGLQIRLFQGYRDISAGAFRERIRSITLSIRSQMPTIGWDWADLQEASLRTQRLNDKKKLSFEEQEKLYTDEIQAKDELIQELQAQLMQHPTPLSIASDDGAFLDKNLSALIGPEIYEGEFSDRIKYAVRSFLETTGSKGADKRTRAVLGAFQQKTEFSQELTELKKELRRATKDSKKACTQLQRLLHRYGYSIKSDKGHPRMEANPGYIGLDSITLSKTPSDNHALRNLVSDIEGVMGLKILKEDSTDSEENITAAKYR